MRPPATLGALHRALHPPVLGDVIPPRDERVGNVRATPLAHVPGQRATHVDAGGGCVHPAGESRRRLLPAPVARVGASPAARVVAPTRRRRDRRRRRRNAALATTVRSLWKGSSSRSELDTPRDGFAPIVERRRASAVATAWRRRLLERRDFEVRARSPRARRERGRDGSPAPTRDSVHLEVDILSSRRVHRVDPRGVSTLRRF